MSFSVTRNPNPGNELAYAEITSAASTASVHPTYADVTGLSATAVVGSRPILVVFDCQVIRNGTANGAVLIQIQEGETVLSNVKIQNNPANLMVPCHREIRLAPSAGSHTYKVTMACLSGGAVIEAAATSPAFIQVLEI